jgi:hypothetical protein
MPVLMPEKARLVKEACSLVEATALRHLGNLQIFADFPGKVITGFGMPRYRRSSV